MKKIHKCKKCISFLKYYSIQNIYHKKNCKYFRSFYECGIKISQTVVVSCIISRMIENPSKNSEKIYIQSKAATNFDRQLSYAFIPF